MLPVRGPCLCEYVESKRCEEIQRRFFFAYLLRVCLRLLDRFLNARRGRGPNLGRKRVLTLTDLQSLAGKEALCDKDNGRGQPWVPVVDVKVSQDVDGLVEGVEVTLEM